MDALREALRRIDGRGYPAYKDLRGRYRWDGGELHVEHVQGDPFAAPSRLRVVVPAAVAGLEPWLLAAASRRVGVADVALRRLAEAAERASGHAGSGKSGLISVDAPGQEILARSACEVGADGAVTLRFYVGLPARGRRILGPEAEELLTRRVPWVVEQAVGYLRGDEEVAAWARAVEDQRALRAQLAARGLVAFVADGAVLPRRSGASDRPMAGAEALPWAGPPSLAVTLEAPHAGAVTGTGIPRGVTLICGGGYHGKSTLLDALARGIYDHVPGDGRERVVTDPTAMTVRAEDGRQVSGVDISAFIDGLPPGPGGRARSTRAFSTADASGSTSQAAALVEALELGAETLLLDEDTCATNFMIRDRRMQALVASEDEPITPLVDHVAALRDALGVSAVLVMGGSGDYFDVADTVLVMRGYRPADETARAREIAASLPTGRAVERGGAVTVAPRAPTRGAFDLRKGKRPVKVRGRGTRALELGRETVEIGALDQLVSPSQTRLIGDAVAYAVAQGWVDGQTPLRALAERLAARVAEAGPAALSAFGEGDRAAVRAQEIGAAINRLRTLEVAQLGET